MKRLRNLAFVKAASQLFKWLSLGKFFNTTFGVLLVAAITLDVTSGVTHSTRYILGCIAVALAFKAVSRTVVKIFKK